MLMRRLISKGIFYIACIWSMPSFLLLLIATLLHPRGNEMLQKTSNALDCLIEHLKENKE